MRVILLGTLNVAFLVAASCTDEPLPVGPGSDSGAVVVGPDGGVVVSPDGSVYSGINGVRDGDETDVDCGGSTTPVCADGKACVQPEDCASSVCVNKACQAPGPTDGVRNGDETDIDCGGSAPVVCAQGAKCKLDKDCSTKNCTAGVCSLARGIDGIKNGTETDCGGPDAPACLPGKACEAATDCTSKLCDTNVCTTPNATDGVRNGDETDVDCGGSASPRCVQGQTCTAATSCVNGLCNAGKCANVYLFDVNHILSTGQSNSVGNGGGLLTTSQPYNNISFDTGVMTSGTCDGDGCKTYQTPSSFVPLKEGDRFTNFATETMSSGLGNEATLLARSVYFPANPVVTDFRTLVSLHGRSGNKYICLRKGGCPTWYASRGYIWAFDEGMMQVQSAMTLAQANGLSYVVRGVTAVHGEGDNDDLYFAFRIFPLAGTDGTANKIQNYEDALVEWQQDYENSIKAITGQTLPVPLYISQMNGWTWSANRYNSVTAINQYTAHKRALGKVVLVTPGYIFPFANDFLHYTAEGQRRMGEYFAKAYMSKIVTGRDWEPVRPKVVSLAGNVITVQFYVPVPPLALDTTLVSQAANYGFNYTDDSGAVPAITSVALAGADSVTITLASPPTGGAKKISYANVWNGSVARPGPFTGVRGNLRDSDATASQSGGGPLHNWSVSFEETVP
jgi:hypothetical protein